MSESDRQERETSLKSGTGQAATDQVDRHSNEKMSGVRWPTWLEWIAIAKYVKKLVFGKPIFRLASLLITLGVSFIGGATIGQVGFALFLGWINRQLDSPIPDQAISNAISGSVIVGLSLIAAGALVFAYGHFKEEKARKEEKPQFELEVHPRGKCNWMTSAEKYARNGKFMVRATVDLVIGSDKLHLTEVEVHYFADGCCCCGVRTTFSIDGVEIPGDWGSELRTPRILEAETAHTMSFQLILRPYWAIREPADCDFGQLELRLHILNTRTSNPGILTTYFQFHNDGTLGKIRQLASPPFFSDEMVKNAYESKIISEDEYIYLSGINETIRFRAWNASNPSESGLISDLNLPYIREIGRRIQSRRNDSSRKESP